MRQALAATDHKEKSMTSPRALLRAWNIQARKKLGQHFLENSAIADKIVSRAGVGPDETVLEIGAGLGALTVPLARSAKRVIAIEKDARLMDLLKTEIKLNRLENVDLLEEDILRFDFRDLANRVHPRPVVFGNLPYNISSQVLVRLIVNRSFIQRAVLMFQRELGERLTAKPGRKSYGRLTVMLRYCADLNIITRVDAAHFFPKPKVDSDVIEVAFKDTVIPDAENEKFLFSVIKAAFGRRRKNLKNALLGSELNLGLGQVREALSACEIDPTRRAETLEVAEFVSLSNHLQHPPPRA